MPVREPEYFSKFKFEMLEFKQHTEAKFAEFESRFDRIDQKLGDVIGMLADRFGRVKSLEDENTAGAHRVLVMQDEIEEQGRKIDLHDEEIKSLKTAVFGK